MKDKLIEYGVNSLGLSMDTIENIMKNEIKTYKIDVENTSDINTSSLVSYDLIREDTGFHYFNVIYKNRRYVVLSDYGDFIYNLPVDISFFNSMIDKNYFKSKLVNLDISEKDTTNNYYVNAHLFALTFIGLKESNLI